MPCWLREGFLGSAGKNSGLVGRCQAQEQRFRKRRLRFSKRPFNHAASCQPFGGLLPVALVFMTLALMFPSCGTPSACTHSPDTPATTDFGGCKLRDRLATVPPLSNHRQRGDSIEVVVLMLLVRCVLDHGGKVDGGAQSYPKLDIDYRCSPCKVGGTQGPKRCVWSDMPLTAHGVVDRDWYIKLHLKHARCKSI